MVPNGTKSNLKTNNMKVSNKLSRRSRRYFFDKKVNNMIYRDLAKGIQEAIDEQIIKKLKEIAKEINNEESLRTDLV